MMFCQFCSFEIVSSGSLASSTSPTCASLEPDLSFDLDDGIDVFKHNLNCELNLDFDVDHDLDIDLNLVHDYDLQPNVDLG